MSVTRVAFTLASTLLALGASDALRAAESNRIEEIVVTAEKREASLQETSIAITAFSQDDLDARGIGGIEDLQFATPDLVISHNSQSPVTYAYIRGIGSDQLVAGFDPGVAYNVDGVYVGQPSSMPVDLWDMQRVEVLRGPQGTLYGRNTTGGSINVITADPTQDFYSKFDLTGGNYGRISARGVVSGQLTDSISSRFTAIVDNADGYQDNMIGPDADRTDDWAVRDKLKFDLSDSATLVVTGQYFKNEGNQGQKRKEPFGDIPVYEGAIPNPSDPRKVAKDHNEKLDLENELVSARLDWDVGFAKFVSITGYIHNDWFQTMDIDMSSNPIQHQDWNMRTNQLTQEFQLISTGESALQWILGAFYFNENLDTRYFFQDTSTPPAGFGFNFSNGGKLDTESKAVYGQATYDLRRSADLPIRFVAGARYTKDYKKINEYQIIPEFGVDLSGPECPICRSDKSWDEWTGKLGIDWFVVDDVMAYASWSRGYKGGGFSIGQFDSYDPETVDAYEIGVKSTLWDGRATANVSAFYYDYQDLQVNFLLFTSFTTDNAAAATIQGVEFEGTVLPIDNLTLSASASYLSAEFDKYQFSDTIDLKGDTLNRAPKYTTNLAAQYDFSLGSAGNLAARVDYHWQDSLYLRVQNLPRHRVDDQYTANASLTWTSGDEKWLVSAFCDNLTDEDNIRGLTVSDGLSTGNNTFLSYSPPQTYGVRIGYTIGG